MEARSEVTFGLCPVCADLDAHAFRLLDAHPAIRHAIGSPNIGRHHLVSAFHALAVMGVKPGDAYTDDGLASLIDRLSGPGVAASWSRQFAPIWRAGADRATAAAEPWLHVGVELRAEIRAHYFDHLAGRMPPRPVECPSRGCAWCGLGTVMAKRTAKAWAPVTFHGFRGHLCPTCQRYSDEGRGMHGALLDHADPGRAIRRRHPYEPDVQGVRGWAETPGVQPSREPWAHVDLDHLRAILTRGV
jgi:hypothetical protein